MEYDFLSPGGTPSVSRRCSETGSAIIPPPGSPSPQRLRSRSNSRTSRRVSLIPGEALEQAHAALALAKEQEEKSQNRRGSGISVKCHPPSHPTSLPQLLGHASNITSASEKLKHHDEYSSRRDDVIVRDDLMKKDHDDSGKGDDGATPGDGTGGNASSPQR